MRIINQNERIFEIEIFQMILTNIIKININKNFCDIIETIINILKIKKKKTLNKSLSHRRLIIFVQHNICHIFSNISTVVMLKFIIGFHQSNNA